MNDPATRPIIITFYSYKGGTGRSMALANVAWILASNGKRVLLLDWDLEAPGLHRYLHPFLRDRTLVASEGIIDFVGDFAFEAVAGGAQTNDEWFVPHANILRYASSLTWDFPTPGTIDFVPAGRQGADYATRVNSFNWESFYKRLGGGLFLEAAKKSMVGYDYVLIDSRTGVSDTSGVCTVQMPDRLVVCFTLNTQSIDGAAAVALSAQKQRRKPNGEPGLKIFPVPMRVELSEKLKLDVANDLARQRFDPLLWHLTPEERGAYWSSVRVLYHPFYAYEEVLATFGDRPMQAQSVILPSMEALTGYLTDGGVRQFPPLEESKRLELLDRYTRKPTPAPSTSAGPSGSWIFYFSYDRSNQDQYLRRFFADLSEEVRIRLGQPSGDAVGFFDQQELNLGDDWPEATARALRTCRVLVSMVSPAYVGNAYNGREVAVFRDRSRLARGTLPEPRMIMPIVWVPLRSKTLPPALERLQLDDARFPSAYREHGLRYLMRLRRFEEDYRELTARLAEELIQTHQSTALPFLDTLPRLQDVANLFEEETTGAPAAPRGGPRHVECVLVVAPRDGSGNLRSEGGSTDSENGSNWYPFAPSVRYEVGILARQTAVEAQLTYSAVPFGADLSTRIEQARRDNTVVVVVVDVFALLLDRYRTILAEMDRQIHINRAVLVVWSHDEATQARRTELTAAVQGTFEYSQMSRDGYFRGEIRSAQDFKVQFIDAVAAIRITMIERALVLRNVEEQAIPRPSIEGARG